MTAALALLVASMIGVIATWGRRMIVPPRVAGAGTVAPPVSSRGLARWMPAAWRRPAQPSDDEVAEWCEQVARDVRAGSSLTHAIVTAGAAAGAGGAPFRPAVHALTRGRGLAHAFEAVDGGDDPASPVGLVVPVLTACAELGGPAAMPLERVAAILQARSAERAERRVNSAQARLSARVLSTVPLGVLALLAVAQPTVRSAIASPVGAFCVLAGGLFNVAGWWWMRRLIAGAG